MPTNPTARVFDALSTLAVMHTGRADESVDSWFYEAPRFVTHIDDNAIASLTEHYRSTLAPQCDVLDLCSSWISHLPRDVSLGRVVGLGMNEEELQRNAQLSEYVVQDLNRVPVLPFNDSTFDAVVCAVSVDYLTQPREIFEVPAFACVAVCGGGQCACTCRVSHEEK